MDIQQLVKKYIYWPEMENSYQKNIDFSKTKMKDLSEMLKSQLYDERFSINDYIIRFYSLNEALALLRQKENNILDDKTIEIYNSYHKEIETLSKKIFAYLVVICTMEARHCEDYNERKRGDEKDNHIRYYLSQHLSYPRLNTQEYREKEKLLQIKAQKYATKKVRGKDKVFLSDYIDGIMTDKEFNSFLDTHTIIEKLVGIEDYEADDVYEIFAQFDKPENASLTIKDYLASLKKIFINNNFEEGYGGSAWSTIAEHALKFCTGKINAEVFVDQAFSLEHNNGNIFNKDVIFVESAHTTIFHYDLMAPEPAEYSTNETQFLLNLQHKGLLLSFFNVDFSSISPTLNKFMEFIPIISAEEKNAIFSYILNNPKFENIKHDVLQSCLRHMSYLNKEINYIQTSRVEEGIFQSVLDQIKTQNLPLPSFDLNEALNDLKFNKKGQKLKLNEDTKLFGELFNYLLQSNKVALIPPAQDFKFQILNTKNIPAEFMTKEHLGNKAFGLAQMQEDKLPVPLAMVFTTENANPFFHEQKKWLQILNKQLPSILKEIAHNKLCSVRSGAAVSMPGMMDTILNVGIDDSNYDYFCGKLGKKVTDQCAIKFMDLFCKSIGESTLTEHSTLSETLLHFKEVLKKKKIFFKDDSLFPLNAKAQYFHSVKAVFSSWYSERAVSYRNHHNISHEIGTAAIIQQMVFGNLNNQSCTGVVFSRDCINGKPGIIGEFLPNAQGEDVVSGAVTPTNISHMEAFNPRAYQQLTEICETLEKKTGDIQDIEFTIEDGELYILQKRKAVCSNQAQYYLNQELYQQGLIEKEELIRTIQVEDLIPRSEFEPIITAPIGQGLVANPGVMRGIVISCNSDIQKYSDIFEQHKHEKNFGWIFYSKQTSPEHAPIMIKTQAFVTSTGGFTSHAAILARSWDKPCVVGIGSELSPGALVSIDAHSGNIYEGICALSTKNTKKLNKSINHVLKHYQVDAKQFDNTPHELITEHKNHKTWMQQYPSKIIKPPVKPVATKFLDIGNKIAILLIKEQTKKMSL